MTLSLYHRHNIQVTGTGKQTMLLAHGFGCDQTMWRWLAPAFQDHYRVVLFDHLGAGHSDRSQYRPDKYSTLQGYAADLLEILDAVGGTPALYVGHSVSAMIGVLAAIERPAAFARLILIGPSPCYLNDGEYRGGFRRSDLEQLLELLARNDLGWASTMAPLIMANPDRPELAQEWVESFCRTDPDIAQQFARVTFFSDNRADLARVQTPALILQCSEDLIAPDWVGNFVHQHLSGSRLVKMQATGHCPHLSAPQETIAAIKEYLGVA